MNLRVIKKDIDFFVSEFIDDCTLCMALNDECDEAKINEIIDEAVDLYNDLKYKVNHPAEGQSKKAYYDAVIKEMFEKLDELCEKLSGAISKK
ncbi:MAG: hypothetical protein J6X69_07520 [Bacteroidales bacterium]|nr:hypothetical protein [Bacteroidales bacterium]